MKANSRFWEALGYSAVTEGLQDKYQCDILADPARPSSLWLVFLGLPLANGSPRALEVNSHLIP